MSELTLEHARAYAADLQGQVTKYEGHPLKKPVPDSTFAPQTVHTYLRYLSTFSAWLMQEGYSKDSIFARLELPKLSQTQIEVLKPEEI